MPCNAATKDIPNEWRPGDVQKLDSFEKPANVISSVVFLYYRPLKKYFCTGIILNTLWVISTGP